MKRLLLISYAFPPFLAPESLLVLRTVRELEKLGWKITVLTVDEHARLGSVDTALMDAMPSSVEIVRVFSLEKNLTVIPQLKKYILKLLFYLGLPGEQFLWYPFALAKARSSLMKNNFDVILSWACPHASNVVGLSLKRMSGLPWVAHFSDPWVDNPYSRPTGLQKKTWGKLERSIIREADGVVFVTSQTSRLVMGKYPSELTGKVNIIPHGYNLSSLASINIHLSVQKRFRLVYVGSFYPGMRTPLPLLQALKLLKNRLSLNNQFEVVFVGPNTKSYQYVAEELRVADLVSFHGPVSFESSLCFMAEADVLVAIDAPSDLSSVFLPSKLVDYMMFKKPILGITPINGASADLLRRLECPVADPDDVESIARVILNLFQLWESGNLGVSQKFRDVVGEYNIVQTTKTLDEALCNAKRQCQNS